MKLVRPGRSLFAALLAPVVLAGGSVATLLGTCGPFTDEAADAFCPFVLEIFYLGITTGTTPTTFDPTSNVSRLQMAAFLSRTVDGALRRGSRRAALDQFWTAQNSTALGLTTVPNFPYKVRSDGADLWVTSQNAAAVSRVRASDGKLLETWTGATGAYGVLTAMGRVLATGSLLSGALYAIDPKQPAGAVTTVATNLGVFPLGMAFDGGRVWTANEGLSGNGSVSIVTPGATTPWTVTTVTVGFVHPDGAIFDGTSVWVTDQLGGTGNRGEGSLPPPGPGVLLKLSATGAILQTVTLGVTPGFPIFDGANIWVPNQDSNTLTVVRASSGAVLQTLTGNGLAGPIEAAFNGERVLVTNALASISLWKAADLSPLGSLLTGVSTGPNGACSDGINFWIVLNTASRLARF